MLRVGIVGSGSMGSTHIESWSKTPATITGITSVDTEKAKHLANAYNTKYYDDFDTLLSDVDVIDICVPTHLHHQFVLKAATAGKQILCEKPLARTVEQAEKMIEVCKQKGVKLLVGHVVRFFPEYALAKQAVLNGDIGDVGVIHLKRCSFQPVGTDGNWYTDEQRSGGMIMDLMIHDLDYARWVAGEVESVFAKQVRSKNPDSVGDYALIMLRHKSGAISNIEGAWAYPEPMFRTGFEIAGDGGLIDHPAGSSTPLTVHLKESAGGASGVGIPRSPLIDSAYTVEIKHFYDVLVNNVEPRVTAHDGLMAVKMALTAIKSAKTGQRMNMEDY